ncbi:VOC family protein [Terracidiphilus gabretensis]|jgi:predicted 3-demethylubiquinone-9 3-methyltransferase (glyoxalase superfamily)|uniref:VOC family protein n=1 Tax=Terracidiphilus gabretensis TaxID=1577687 RepID=UPI00071B251F|nr:VOC family protein [Terracidiphilus gabretensis]
MSLFENFPRITPFLWFNNNAEEAVDFYVSIFKNSRRHGEMRSPADNPSTRAGAVLTVSFELDGQQFTAMNGGPGHNFTDAISLVVRCESQEEIDHYWSRLTEGGAEVACGWLKDKFGLSWQIVPANIGELLNSPKAFQALMQMKKFDIAALKAAAQ